MNHLERLLEQLKSNKKRQDAKDNLDAIFNACSKLKSIGVTDFSISNIARFGSDIGVPKEQSIRNSNDYVALIKAFDEECNFKKVAKRRRSSRDAWIEDIDNPRLQLLVRKLSSDLKVAHQQIDEMKPINNTITVKDFKIKGPELLQQERRALEYLISKEFLDDHNFVRGKRGDVTDNNGKEFLKVGTLTAIEKILE